MLGRFVHQAGASIDGLLPRYRPTRAPSLASYRPVEIENRPSPVTQDDTKAPRRCVPLAADGGRANPARLQQHHPDGAPRVWDVGEPFERVVQRFFRPSSRDTPPSAPGRSSGAEELAAGAPSTIT